MSISLILLLVVTLVRLAIFAFVIYAAVQGVKALRKYNRSGEVRKEKAETRRSLGEVLKEHRVRCKMTQEFVAESLGVSRQAVSKWETGTADPSTSNLLALAKLFGVSAEELLRQVDRMDAEENRIKRRRPARAAVHLHPPGCRGLTLVFLWKNCYNSLNLEHSAQTVRI